MLEKPRGPADDLKQISGVGPELEKTLNELGIFHFEQIAQLDERLSFKERIERENWVAQANQLLRVREK